MFSRYSLNFFFFNIFHGFTYSESIKVTTKSDVDEWPYLHFAQFTPSGSALVMVYNYDIYYTPGPRAANVYRVTRDAVPGVVYNGIPDWLYEGMRGRKYSDLIEKYTAWLE